MVDSQMVSREGGEQYLVVEHDGEEYEARLRTVIREIDGEEQEVDEYKLSELDEDESYPTAIEKEVKDTNQQLHQRGGDGE